MNYQALTAALFFALGCSWIIAALRELVKLHSGGSVEPVPYQFRGPFINERGVLRGKAAIEWRRLFAWLGLGMGLAMALGFGMLLWDTINQSPAS